jgi:hypothetical protein
VADYHLLSHYVAVCRIEVRQGCDKKGGPNREPYATNCDIGSLAIFQLAIFYSMNFSIGFNKKLRFEFSLCVSLLNIDSVCVYFKLIEGVKN